MVGIKRFSRQIQDTERLELDDVRRLAADIHSTADRLDRMIEGMLETDDDDGLEVTPGIPAAETAVVAARGTY